jgi:oligoribonuclease NrnB/cAMP/cGMP phosphodiesterase (DHH superfamily)
MQPQDVDLVIYHGGCSDGFGAAYAAWRALGDRAEYLPAKYGQVAPDVTGRNVLIADFSYPRDALLRMKQQAKGILVLDHHKSAMEDLAGLDFAQFDVECSGAMLAWAYFHPDEYPPMLIRYIQDRDLWQWRLPDSREFSAGLMTVPHTFEDYDRCSQSIAVQRLISQGTTIVGYIDQQVEWICKHAVGRRLKAAGHLTCRMVNSPIWQSEVGAHLCEDVDVGVVWHLDHRKGTWQVSMRSRQGVDLTPIARLYSGGGHTHAAGFSLGPKAHIEDIFEDE